VDEELRKAEGRRAARAKVEAKRKRPATPRPSAVEGEEVPL